MEKPESRIKHYENWCKTHKGTLSLGWFFTTFSGLLVSRIFGFSISSPFVILSTFCWLSWGIGAEIPQNGYKWFKKKIEKE